MGLIARSQSLKLRDDGSKTLGASRITPGSLSCSTGLTEGADFEVDYHHGTVRRLRPVGEAVHTFTFQHDDRAAELAATEAEQARKDLTDNYQTAMTQLDAIIASGTALPESKTLARVLRRSLRLLKAALT